MAKHLVLVGGGHAHLTVMKHMDEFIQKGHRVTLIGPATHHYYSGMGPGLLSGIYKPGEVRFHIQKMADDRGGAFVLGKVARIDAEQRRVHLDTGDTVDYDVLSVNTGSFVPMDGIQNPEKNIFPVKPIENLMTVQNAILDRLGNETLRLLVIGGGPAGLELTGNLWRLVNDYSGSAEITFLTGSKLLSSFPEKVRTLAIQSLAYRGIQIVEGVNVRYIKDGMVVMDDERRFPYDFTLLAWGIKPPPMCRESGLPTDEDGGLLVNEFLQCVNYPEIFGGGDCIGFQPRPLDKVGVYPVRENPILYQNLLASVNGETMKPFDPQGDYLLIFNLGDGTGIFKKKNWIWKGKLAFYLKNYIDKKFMKEFQVSGELDQLL